MYKTKYITNAPEKISIYGNWCKSYEIGDTTYFTRSGILWGGILGRVKNQPYPCKNEFKNFNEFSECVQNEVGFREKEENGRFWAIDKDLLIKRNIVYSPSTICFIPQEINNLFLKQERKGLSLPLGVVSQERNQPYASYITIKNKRKFLGRYYSILEAHKAWQKAKIEKIENLQEDYFSRVDIKVIVALENRKLDIIKEMKNDEFTIL